MGLNAAPIPNRVQFKDTLKRCLDDGVIDEPFAKELRQLMELRNPLAHYRDVNDASNLTRRAMETSKHPQEHLIGDATFAMSVAVKLLSLPSFRLDGGKSVDD